MKLKYCIVLLFSCALFCCLYNPLALYFLSDDFDSMLMAQTWHGIVHSYRPGSDLLLHTDHLLYNYHAGGYHVTNYLLHFITAFLLFFTCKQLLLPLYSKTAAEKYALTASLIFLFYPFHSECIFWLVGRSSILAALFAMASMYCFLRSNEGTGWYVLSLLCLMLGLFSYESVWTLPVVVSILSFVYHKTSSLRHKLWRTGGYWLTFFTYLLSRFLLTSTVIGTPYGTQKIAAFDSIFLLRNFASLLSRSFVAPMQSAVAFVCCLCIVAVVLMIVFFKIKRHITTPFIFFFAAYLLCLLPVLPIGIGTHDTESERVLYLPSAFLSMIISMVLFILFNSKTLYAITALIVVEIIFLLSSYQSFKAAGKVTKATVLALQSLPATNTIYCIQLPGQYNGGFIFRNGIASAAGLFAPQIKQVNILSQRESINVKQDYRLHVYPVTNLPALIETDALQRKSIFNAAFFVWTDSSVNVYK